MMDSLFTKLRDYLWVPVVAPFDHARGPFRWGGPDAGPLAHRHPTAAEFARYVASFHHDTTQHYERDTEAARRYLAQRGAKDIAA